jgi:hypothetical protein
VRWWWGRAGAPALRNYLVHRRMLRATSRRCGARTHCEDRWRAPASPVGARLLLPQRLHLAQVQRLGRQAGGITAAPAYWTAEQAQSRGGSRGVPARGRATSPGLLPSPPHRSQLRPTSRPTPWLRPSCSSSITHWLRGYSTMAPAWGRPAQGSALLPPSPAAADPPLCCPAAAALLWSRVCSCQPPASSAVVA